MERKIYLDGLYMINMEGTHKYLKKQFDFPNYYGGNLDALWDCISEISDDISVILSNTDFMQSYLGEYADKLISLFKDADEEMYNFSLIIE